MFAAALYLWESRKGEANMQKQVPYDQGIDRLCPRELVIGIARDQQGKYNPIALGWMMNTSHKPPMMAISIGKTRYSLDAIRTAGEFVIALPSADQADQTMLYGTKTGRDVDKLALSGEKTQPAEKIDCVLLADAVANFECKLVGELETGDHVIFVGQVVCSHVNEEPRGRLYILGPNHGLGGLSQGIADQ